MSSSTKFRTPDEEVLKLLNECAELKQTLKTISAQLSRIENRVRRSFPVVAERASAQKVSAKQSSLTPEQALAEFDKLVTLTASGASEEAERLVEAKGPSDLLVMAKELGVSFPKNKPSKKSMRDAIFGKVRESVFLTKHNTRT